jgi:DNA-directed RNA polymerase specialized sigma24 family protein
MSEDLLAADLVIRAAAGDKQAWDALVDRYAPLVWSICRRHRLGDAEAGRFGQAVWTQLDSQLGAIRDPAALACWLAATAASECGRVPHAAPDGQAGMAEQEVRRLMLREALDRLPARCRKLITMLTEDPPVPHAQISTTLGVPVDGIGPASARCLEKLRRDPAIAALINPAPPWSPR